MPVINPEPSAPPDAEIMLNRLLEAIRDGNHPAFIAPGTERFQQGITPEMFARLGAQLAVRLRAGYTSEFLTEIRQCEHRVYLWKLNFSDAGNQFVARLVLTQEGQVTGFMLN